MIGPLSPVVKLRRCVLASPMFVMMLLTVCEPRCGGASRELGVVLVVPGSLPFSRAASPPRHPFGPHGWLPRALLVRSSLPRLSPRISGPRVPLVPPSFPLVPALLPSLGLVLFLSALPPTAASALCRSAPLLPSWITLERCLAVPLVSCLRCDAFGLLRLVVHLQQRIGLGLFTLWFGFSGQCAARSASDGPV